MLKYYSNICLEGLRERERERDKEEEEEDSWPSHIIFEHKAPPDITCLQVFIQ
jgi:hypothetical protein